ncbi:hypothetical protein ACP6PL_25290 [Dapis sp. BLCC M126]|uniref:hypothetical protein n=1 Tax=Dapis sp. BLCC M126 TaxID=3400189 RepID=UPI003CEDD545
MLNINKIKTNIVAIATVAITICSSPLALAENYTREFDEQGYLRQNPDVAELVSQGKYRSGYEHYVRYGQYENRSGAFKTFNEQEYLRQNPDVADAVRRGEFKSGYDHYLKHGQYENRYGTSNPSQPQTYDNYNQSSFNNNNNNRSCEGINRNFSQEAFFRTENRIIHICRYQNSNKLVWFERRNRDNSGWRNFPVEVAYNGFVNPRRGYFINDNEFIRRRGNQTLYREQVLNKWRHNCRQTSPYSSDNTF